MKQFILGSQSPRRKEILSYFTIPFEQVSSDFDEDSIPFNGDPGEYAKNLAIGKSAVLQNKHPDAFILTADTVVYCNEKIYNKPKDEEEAFLFVTELQGKWHSVFTAVSLAADEEAYQAIEESRVLFNPLTADQIKQYHSRIHWADKAGGYAIQLGGGLIIKKIDGCYYNIMGLPINSVRLLLKKFGIELWDFVK